MPAEERLTKRDKIQRWLRNLAKKRKMKMHELFELMEHKPYARRGKSTKR